MHIERFLSLRLAPQLCELQGLKPGTGESVQVKAHSNLVRGDPENPTKSNGHQRLVRGGGQVS